MIEFTAFTYTLLASFILSSAGRNRRDSRPHQPVLKLAGIVLMAMSFTLAALLFATVGYLVLIR
jgi:ABC-type Na+ efflux pump permease subunit